MYTLEDDQETSGRLRQGDFQNSPYAAQADAQAGNAANLATPPASGSAPVTTSSTKPIVPDTIANPAHKRLAIMAMLVACASVFITSMDQTVVVTALPKIIADPGINIPITELDHAAWIISAYLLGFVIAMPLMGRVSDIFGRRRIMLICLSLFGLGSVFCALSPALGQTLDLSFLNTFGIDTSSPGLVLLISARFIQAIGGGAIVPVAMAIVSDFYGRGRLGLALGIIGAVTEAGGVVGPLYGALIVQTLGWTYIFYLNVPIVLLLMVGTWFFTPRNQRLREGIDWLGAVLLGLALTCLSLGLAQQGTDFGPSVVNSVAPQNNPISLIFSLVFFVLFILLERRKSWRVPRFSLRQSPHIALVRETRWPVIDITLFKKRAFSAASLVSLFIGVALIIAMADITLYVDTVFSQQIAPSDQALVSGLVLLRMTAMIPVGAILGGWLCHRLSCRLIGMLGLLFAAAGFFLMSRWSINLDWTQITISTMTAGLGFGLVIAPISTSAINSTRADQVGMGSSIVTALRMVGMILGLAALTSWALAYFKQLASQFPSLPLGATAAQFTQWSLAYAAHLIDSAHTVYGSVFYITMFLCLIAIIPAAFLWGRSPTPVQTLQPDPALAPDPIDPTLVLNSAHQALAPDPADAVVLEPTLYSATTVPAAAVTTVLPELDDEFAPLPPPPTPPGRGSSGGRGRPSRRLVLALIGIALVLLLLAGGLTALLLRPSTPSSSSGVTGAANATPTVVPGTRMIQLALNSLALTSIFTSELNLKDGTLSNIQATPMPNNGLVMTLDLNINADGLQRTLPVELDTTIGLDSQHNIQLKVLHVKRDGIDAGPTAAANMQQALNGLVLKALMPALQQELQTAKLVGVSTTSTMACGNGAEMLVLLIQAPPIQGVAAQPTPSTLCFTQPVDLTKLLG